jgi:hypothetical protein
MMGQREISVREAVSWEDIVAAEPRFEQLLRYATWVIDPGGPYFCANEIWFNLFKPHVVKLVGWGREWQMDAIKNAGDILGESQAYDLAYEKIYDTLPGCRNCGCL